MCINDAWIRVLGLGLEDSRVGPCSRRTLNKLLDLLSWHVVPVSDLTKDETLVESASDCYLASRVTHMFHACWPP